jgi:hypothetical protein
VTAELVPCPRCDRNNGARRTTCIYCGAPLPVTDATAAVQVPTLRAVEEWESGFSVVLAPLDERAPTARQVERLAEVTRMEPERARAILASRASLPVVRVASEHEAALVARLLGEADLGASVVADAALELGRHLRRVREVRLADAALEIRVLWGDWVSIARDDLVAVVEGRVVSTKTDLLEGVGRKRGAPDLVESSQYFVESSVADLYGPSLETSFRVKAESFDFACLGGKPSHRLDENFAALGRTLERFVGPSRYDASFQRVARLLDHAWPRASRVDARGLGRRGDFKKYTVSSVTSDGLAQFDRYSRTKYALARP